MNKFFGLLLVIGGVFAVVVNRDKIAAWRNGQQESAQVETSASGEAAPPPSSSAPGPAGTPHPAKEAQAQASRLYPGLVVPGSALNKRFLALHADAQRLDPELLTRPDWPITLAERAMVSLGGAPLPRGTPAAAMTPKPLPGSALDARPKKH